MHGKEERHEKRIFGEPFDPDLIKAATPTDRTVLDGDSDEIIQRLNDRLGANWSFRIVQYRIVEDLDQVLALGRLTVKSKVWYQFGRSTIKRSPDNGEALSLGEDLKAAGLDSLKKWAKSLGITDSKRRDKGGDIQ